MPLPTGKIMSSAETQANVSSRMEQAMADLALKAELQREEKARNEAERSKKEAEEKEVNMID